MRRLVGVEEVKMDVKKRLRLALSGGGVYWIASQRTGSRLNRI